MVKGFKMEDKNLPNIPNDDEDIFNMMSEEEINSAFGDILQASQILLAKGCNCSKPWDYCI